MLTMKAKGIARWAGQMIALAACIDPTAIAAQPQTVAAARDGRRDTIALNPMTLEAALAAAETDNIDVITARLAVQTARANLRSADTAPNPVFSTNLVQVRPSQIGKLAYPELADTVVRLDLPLERGGKRRARVGAARASINAAESDFGDARRQMRLAVASAYFDLKAAEAHLSTLRAVADSYVDSQNVAGKQQRAGALSVGDLARQKVETLKAETDARQAASDLRDSQLALATLIGREGDAATLGTTGDWPMPGNMRNEPADLLALRRPDVLAAQARVEAARRNLDGAHALKHPDVTVGAQYERADGDLGVGSSVGVGVSIPLPVRNLYHGEVDAAGIALNQAEIQARKTAAVATAEIVLARRALDEASARRKLFDESQLPAARKAADVAEFSYAHGAMTLLDLLDSRRSLKATELDAIDAHADEARAIAKLGAAETTGDE